METRFDVLCFLRGSSYPSGKSLTLKADPDPRKPHTHSASAGKQPVQSHLLASHVQTNKRSGLYAPWLSYKNLKW